MNCSLIRPPPFPSHHQNNLPTRCFSICHTRKKRSINRLCKFRKASHQLYGISVQHNTRIGLPIRRNGESVSCCRKDLQSCSIGTYNPVANSRREDNIKSAERNGLLYLQNVRDFVQCTHNFSDIDSCLCFLHHIDAVFGTSNLCEIRTSE